MNTPVRWRVEDWADGSSPRAQAVAYVAFAIAYFALSTYATDLPVQTRFPHFIWPADGLVLGTLLAGRRRRPPPEAPSAPLPGQEG